MAYVSKMNSEYWLVRAAKSRAIADSILDHDLRALLLQVAADYMRLAERAAQREAATKPAPAPTKKTVG